MEASPDGLEIVTSRGLWFDELRQDVIYRHSPGRTVSEADNIAFSTMTMNPQALHLDAAWSARQEFGERLVNSMFTLSLVVGLSVPQLTQGTIVANLGFTEIMFPNPVRHGDTVYAQSRVLEMRESNSRPSQGIATFEHTGVNQRGEVVIVARRTTLMWSSKRAGAESD